MNATDEHDRLRAKRGLIRVAKAKAKAELEQHVALLLVEKEKYDRLAFAKNREAVEVEHQVR